MEHTVSERHAIARRVVAALGVFFIFVSMIATPFVPWLSLKHPLWLLAVDPQVHNMLLVRGVPVWQFVPVAFIRRIFPLSIAYLIGRWYGEGALRWFEGRSGSQTRRALGWFEKAVRVAAMPVVVIYPMPIACAAAGVFGLSPLRFAISVAMGTLWFVSAAYFLGDVLAGPVDAIRSFFARNLGVVSFVALLFALASGWAWYKRMLSPPEEDTKPLS